MDRCRFVDEHGNRCTRAAHPEAVHVFGGPATIPPMWWEPEETTHFIAALPMLIEHGIVVVEPATKQEADSIDHRYGQLHVAARRLVGAGEALLQDGDRLPRALWTEWLGARARVLVLTGGALVHHREAGSSVCACGVQHPGPASTEIWATTTCIQCLVRLHLRQ